MNYRHAYHAGNFGDVLKHIVLLLCLAYLKRKETPFRVIDTHAGRGLYRLDQHEAEKTGEWRAGIGRLFGPDATPTPVAFEEVVAPYFETLRALNAPGRLDVYPGSPLVAQYALRPDDKLVTNELHVDDATVLRNLLSSDRRCRITNLDAYTALKASLPPKERRGLVLIDPPFEQAGELVRMTEALRDALERFATGIYLLWYPIKDEKPITRFCGRAAEVAADFQLEPVLRVELLLRPLRNPMLLNGAGVLIINPPYLLRQSLEIVLPVLAQRLGDPRKGWYRNDALSLGKLHSLPSSSHSAFGRAQTKND